MPIDFVDDDYAGKLNLVNQQIRDGAFIFVTNR